MLAYVDHGAARGLYRDADALVKKIDEVKWLILSLLVYKVEDENREKIAQKIVEKWLNITASVRYVEDIYTTLVAYRNKMIKTDAELARKILRLISEVKHYLEDVYLTNVLMKVLIDKAFPDIGLIVVYENPLEVEQGRRQRPLNVRNVVLRREAETVYESKLSKSIRRLALEYVILRKQVRTRRVVIDWNCMGMYPYSSSSTSIVNNVEVADPCYCAYMKHGVDIVTTLTPKVAVFQYRQVRELDLKTLLEICDKVQDAGLLVLPSTMTKSELVYLRSDLQNMCTIVGTYSVPVDILLDVCQICNS